MRDRLPLLTALATALTLVSTRTAAQDAEPAGLAASALADTSFHWTRRDTTGIRAWFHSGTYAHQRQDSLLARLPQALSHARAMIDAPPLANPIDVFFIDSREQMRALVGAPVTGFAHVAARATFLVTNPDWRAFERHEIMHVVAGQTWGPLGARNAWLQEGLAQAADGSCGAYSNMDVAVALANRDGWISLETLILKFREQNDMRAYLQSAAFVGWLLDRLGASAIKELWTGDPVPATQLRGRTLTAWEEQWRGTLPKNPSIPPATLTAIDAKGCG